MGSGPTKNTNQNQWQIQNQTTQSAPWEAAQPGLLQALGLANTAAANTYNGSSVAGLDPLVNQGQGQIVNAAQANLPGQISSGAGSYYDQLIKNAGLTDPLKQALAGIDASKANLNPYATGTFLQNGGNPYLDQYLAKANADTAAPINAAFSSAGRYGSPAQAGTVADAVGKQDVAARMADYNQQQQNQLQAIRDMLGLDTAKANISQAGVGNINSAVSALPTIAQGQIWNGQTLQGVGADKMSYAQAVINAANQDPWTKAQNLAQITGGIGQLGGTSNTQGMSYGQTQQQQQTNPGIMGTIGGLISGAGGIANLATGGAFGFLKPPTFNNQYGETPFSDVRLKENIQEVGRLSNGLKIYTFDYKNGGPKQIGFMAQEVEKVIPEAVLTGEDGWKRVNFAVIAEHLNG